MGQIRVIGGERKGFRLKTPAGLSLRPTSNRVREALFNVLAPRIPGARFLDLFAGTGAVGIEALSRGACQAIFVEKDRSALRCLRDNLERCHLSASSEVVVGELPGVLTQLGPVLACDLVYVDPPYDAHLGRVTLDALQSGPHLAAGGLVILEHRKGQVPPTEIGTLVHRRSLRYGETRLSIYLLSTGEPEPDTGTDV